MPTHTTSLITPNADEGLALALMLSRRSVKAIQPDEATRNKLRPDYAQDANSLIAASQVTATYFATIAAANNYWR